MEIKHFPYRIFAKIPENASQFMLSSRKKHIYFCKFIIIIIIIIINAIFVFFEDDTTINNDWV
jgi:hypothetical protein